jgi:Family of unknown function (DUF6084)
VPEPAATSVPPLAFEVVHAEAVAHAAAPMLRFAVRIECPLDVRSILLDAQVQIAARRRPYGEAEQRALAELFGPASEWARSLRTLLWTRATVVVPPFSGGTIVDVDVPCTYDLHVAASRYFDALDDGHVPLEFLFSGSVFYRGETGALQVAQISWEKEALFRLPVRVWREMMDHYFPNSAWLRIRKDTFDRLYEYRSRNALLTWERTLESLLDAAEEEVER